MDDARAVIRRKLAQVKTFLAQETPTRLSESDTKANFIEPVITALGWEGIGVVTREYYVKNSQEFIDYVMAGPVGPLLAIEAKPLQTDLTDKHAAQLIQYCAVEGIEWAALTNGRELQFFNTVLKPDLAAKRVLRLDLLAFNSDAEYDALFEQVWQLSRESMTKPTGVRTWLNQRRLDAALRAILLNPSSSTIRHLRKALADAEVRATPQELAQWFRSHLGVPIATLPIPALQAGAATSPGTGDSGRNLAADNSSEGSSETGKSDLLAGRHPRVVTLYRSLQERTVQRLPTTTWRTTTSYAAAAEDGHTFAAVRFRSDQLIVGLTLPEGFSHQRLEDNAGHFNWARMTKVAQVQAAIDLDETLLGLIVSAQAHATGRSRRSTHYGIGLRDLIDAGALKEGTGLVLVARGKQEVAHATLTAAGEIAWNGDRFRSPSDLVFAPLLGVTKFNGWQYWHADLPGGRETLASVRARVMGGGEENEQDVEDMA